MTLLSSRWPSSRRWSSPALLAVVATLVLLCTPGVAAAEGPGYDGRADGLVLKWQDRKPGTPQDQPAELMVFGRGFRGGSEVTLRVGASAEKAAVADATGAVSLQVDAAAGATIVAAGQAPSGSAWTLLGSAPSEKASRGPRTSTTVTLAALGALALVGMSVRRVSRRGPVRVAIYRAP